VIASAGLFGRPDRFHELAIRAANYVAVSAPRNTAIASATKKCVLTRKFRDLEGGAGGGATTLTNLSRASR
jgi:hypothetical protein